MIEKFVLPYLCLLSCWLTLAGSKICWEKCGGEGQIVPQSIDILDHECRRRTSYPELEDFRCEGKVGPPCTLFKEDKVHVVVEWKNPGFTNLRHSIYWDTLLVVLPWPGLDREVCPYLDGGRGCDNTTVAVNLTGKTRINLSIAILQARLSTFKFPIHVRTIYPAGKNKNKTPFPFLLTLLINSILFLR